LVGVNFHAKIVFITFPKVVEVKKQMDYTPDFMSPKNRKYGSLGIAVVPAISGGSRIGITNKRIEKKHVQTPD